MASPPLTIGLEEEVLLLDPETADPISAAPEALARLAGDQRFKAELPSTQLEISLGPARSVPALIADLAAARRDLAVALDGLARPAAAGVHPCGPAVGPLNTGGRYDELRAEFGTLAARQQVCALQIHVDAGHAERTIAVHDALRAYLPELAALAANAPLYGGRDTSLASVRPMICRLLPRQGVPPALSSAAAWEQELAWGRRAGAFSDDGMWWWELRPHPVYGTLELRVPDAQTTLDGAAAVAAVVHALVATLCERHDAGEELPVPPVWRIEQNRWAACRDGLEGRLADLGTGESVATRDRLHTLLAEIETAGRFLGCARELAQAAQLVDAGGGAAAQRARARADGVGSVPRWLADRFLTRDPQPAVPARG